MCGKADMLIVPKEAFFFFFALKPNVLLKQASAIEAGLGKTTV